jgi:dolichyl-phosphate-mannose-protein mannosyltransferase
MAIFNKQNMARTFNKQNLLISITLVISLLIRIYLSQFDGYRNDIFDFKLWSQGIYNIGITDFYKNIWSDYPPFYLYILWIVGAIYKLLYPSFDINTLLFTILIKFPANLADIFIALLIFKILRKYADLKTAYFGMVIYAFNPAIIYNSAIWGQVDSINTFFILLAIMLMVSDRLEFAGISLAVAILTKPQSLVVLPFVAALMIKELIDKYPLRSVLLKLIKIFVLSIFVFIILALPFYLNTGLITGLIKTYTSGYGQYAYNSVNAFNFWALLGFWKPDNIVIIWLSYKIWGYILFCLLFTYLLIYTTIKNKNGDRKENKNEKQHEDILIYFAFSILLFGFFMFFTRIHERYLFPMFAPFAIVASKNSRLKYVYWILTFTFLFNLYSVLQVLNTNNFIPDGDPYVLAASIINLGMFIFMLYSFSRKKIVTSVLNKE